MNIKSERKNGILVVAPEGRLDAFEAANLGKELEALLKADDGYLVLDMAGVPYLSSGGIRVLLTARKNLAKKNGQVCLCGLTEYPAQVLKMAGMDSIFTTYNTVDEAVNHSSTMENMQRSEKDWRQLPSYFRNQTSFHIYHASDRSAGLFQFPDRDRTGW